MDFKAIRISILAISLLFAGAAQAAESQWVDGWHEESRIVGAVPAKRFIEFLDAASSPQTTGVDASKTDESGFRKFASDPKAFLREHGILVTIVLVLVAGVLLNLTPCVLPMIPVNLALIGAGTENASRKRGACLGGAYAAGIAIAHGIPGALIVVAGGGFIGVLQSSPWFSLVAALLFAVLALALLDVFFIDLSRLRKDGGGTTGIAAAAIAGAVSVLMAGACIEPVTLAVLLLAGDLFASEIHAAVLLPFALGIGMALPWPFLGAGLAQVPRPGMWMVWIKRGFAIFVFVLAAHYARLAWIGFTAGHGDAGQSDCAVIELDAGDMEAWRNALQTARDAKKPVLVDFGASWCRNCDKMDAMFQNDKAVAQRLEQFAVIRVRAEHPRDPAPRKMLDALGVTGLPTFIVGRQTK